MNIANLVGSNTKSYTHSAYSRQAEETGADEGSLKKGFKSTLHIGTSILAARIVADYNIEYMSHRDMADLSNRLYKEGIITQEESRVLAFQPELHPDFDFTTENETNDFTEPDGKRNYLHLWREKVALYEEVGNSKEASNSRQILTILENLNVVRGSNEKH